MTGSGEFNTYRVVSDIEKLLAEKLAPASPEVSTQRSEAIGAFVTMLRDIPAELDEFARSLREELSKTGADYRDVINQALADLEVLRQHHGWHIDQAAEALRLLSATFDRSQSRNTR